MLLRTGKFLQNKRKTIKNILQEIILYFKSHYQLNHRYFPIYHSKKNNSHFPRIASFDIIRLKAVGQG